jgi:hypothetical protein
MTLLAQDSEGMQTLLNAIQEFEEWIGIPVNTMKTKQMTVDGRYLGFWATPNGNMQAAKDLVYDRTRRTKESIRAPC